MKSLDRYILKQIILPALLAFLLIGFLGVAAEIRSNAERFPQGFLTPRDLGFLILFLFPKLVTLLVPIAYFLGILMAFGRLAQQGEITAMQAAGVSLKRLVIPAVLLGVVLSAITFTVQDLLQPWGMNQAYHIMYNELPQRATIDMLDAGELHDYEGRRIFFADKDPKTHTLYDFDLIQPGEDGVLLFHAQEAQLIKTPTEYTLRLKNGYSISQKNMRLNFDSFDKPFPIPSTITRGSFARDSLSLRELYTHQQYMEDNIDKGLRGINPDELRRLRLEIGSRLSTPFSTLAIALIGAPLGVRARRKGRSSLFSIGFGIILFYYALLTVVAPTSLSDLSTYILRLWIPNFVLIGMGIILFMKADRI